MESGQAHITGDLITSLFRASTRGATPKNNWFLDGIFDMVAYVCFYSIPLSLFQCTNGPGNRSPRPFGAHPSTNGLLLIGRNIGNTSRRRGSSHNRVWIYIIVLSYSSCVFSSPYTLCWNVFLGSFYFTTRNLLVDLAESTC